MVKSVSAITSSHIFISSEWKVLNFGIYSLIDCQPCAHLFLSILVLDHGRCKNVCSARVTTNLSHRGRLLKASHFEAAASQDDVQIYPTLVFLSFNEHNFLTALLPKTMCGAVAFIRLKSPCHVILRDINSSVMRDGLIIVLMPAFSVRYNCTSFEI